MKPEMPTQNGTVTLQVTKWHQEGHLLQLVFQKFQKSFKVVDVYPVVANSFMDLLAPHVQTHTDF